MRSCVVGVHELRPDLTAPVVVIDVLRAFTTAAWVLHGGASPLLLAASDGEALALKRQLGVDAVAIRDGQLAPGFDVGNSPGQVSRAELQGKPVVLRTMNGTVAVRLAISAPVVLCASLVNAAATARSLNSLDTKSVTYLVTGENGKAQEDLACAHHIAALVENRKPPERTSDLVRSSRAARDLNAGVRAGFRGVSSRDVEMAAALDGFDFAMRAYQVGEYVRLERTS